jgi:hypothetical protein
MPRKKPTQSSFIVVDVPDGSKEITDALDQFLKNEHKITGKGNRVDAQGISELISALQYVRRGSSRLKTKQLSTDELRHPKIIAALENLGVLKKVLTKEELEKFKATGHLPIDCKRELKEAYSYFVKKALSYL